MTSTDRSGGVAATGSSPTSDRRSGILPKLVAMKVPCVAATTAAITLSGEQTVDGVACEADDRVLVKDQASTAANGIYVVSTGDWTRSTDFDAVDEIVKGTLVYVVTGGTVNGNSLWAVSSADPTTIDSSAITFSFAVISPEALGEAVQALTEDTEPDWLNDYAAGYDASADTGKKWKLITITRRKLKADTTFYVRTDGSNSNDGTANTAGGAWQTINYGAHWIRDNIDVSGFKVVLQVGDGTYTEKVGLHPILGVDPGGWQTSQIVLRGNTTTLGNVLLSVTGDNCIEAVALSTGWRIEGFEFRTTGSGHCIDSDFSSIIYFGKNKLGACAGIHLQAIYGGKIEIVDDYTISGNATSHVYASKDAQILCVSGKTVTISGTPAFSTSFAVAQDGGVLTLQGTTYSGSATGTRWLVDDYGVIEFGGSTNAAQLNGLPGDANGSFTALPIERGGTGATSAAAVALLNNKVVTFTRDISTASGSQSVTGVGFVPQAIIFFATVSGAAGLSAGMVDHGNAARSMFQVTDSTVNSSSGNPITYTNAAGTTAYVGAITSFDSDGFTIAWTKTGSPTGTLTINALCLR